MTRVDAASLESGRQTARVRKVVRRIDAQRHRVNKGHIDSHPRLEGAKLFQLLSGLEG